MATGGSTSSTKGGYDCEFVTVPPKSLECPICLLIVRQPHVISCCGNQFCQPCIGRIQNDNKPCPVCNEANFTTMLHKGVMREVNSLMVRCPQKEMGCKWEGELGQLEEHLNIAGAGKGCGYVMVDCHYKCGKMFLRKDVQEHELHQCMKRPVEVQMNSLVRKLDSLSNKLDTVMAENQTYKVKIERLEEENEDQKTKLQDLKVENQMLRAECNSIQSTCSAMQASVQYVPPFCFTMFNVEHYTKNDLQWRSPPFYSHDGGYKLIVHVFPNGYPTKKGTHLSLFIAVNCGEHDDKLKWPFSGNIGVQMWNTRTNKWHGATFIDFKAASQKHRQKPPLDHIRNVSWGYEAFMSHGHLNMYYKSKDEVRFKISHVELD